MNIYDKEQIKKINEIYLDDEKKIFQDKADLFDFYHEHFPFLLNLINKDEV
jgi:hypothetical protein